MIGEAVAVFAVEDTYQICVKSEKEELVHIKIGGRCFFDHSNGIVKSAADIHKITVPMDVLNREGRYTVCRIPVRERKPYFTETEAVVEREYEFFPVGGEKIRAYHIADAHNMVEEPVKAAKAYGKIDFLILNGDIPDHSGDVKNFDNIYEICEKITKGSIPVVFSRGNHDMRGIYAEKFEDYTPTYNGRSYYTVRLGGLWALILDCGEDKPDGCEEYGNTVCCHEFRVEETDFLKRVIRENKYREDGIFCRAVFSHVPFTQRFNPPFDIEEDIYNQWTAYLNDDIVPDVMICGHTHEITLDRPGGERDHRAQKFSVAVASKTNYKDYFAGAGFEFSKDGVRMTVTDSNGEVGEEILI